VDRYGASATLLDDGRVLVAGGTRYGEHLTTTETYDPTTGTWRPTGSMAMARALHAATRLQNGRVLVAGGFDGRNALATAELYNPATGGWLPAVSMAAPVLHKHDGRLPHRPVGGHRRAAGRGRQPR
jgi:hypothetical protein